MVSVHVVDVNNASSPLSVEKSKLKKYTNYAARFISKMKRILLALKLCSKVHQQDERILLALLSPVKAEVKKVYALCNQFFSLARPKSFLTFMMIAAC